MKFFLSIFLAVVSFSSYACDKACIESLLHRAQVFQDKYQYEASLEVLEEVINLEPFNHEALWRASFSYIRIGWLIEEDGKQESEKRRIEAFTNARKFAIRAYEIDPENYESIFVLGGSKAKLAKYRPIKEQIQIAWDIKDFADRMLAINDQDPNVYYFLAWWNFEIGGASLFERFMAKLFFGGLPEGATVQKGFDLMEKAISLKPEYAVYHHDLGLFHLQTESYKEARKAFRNTLVCPTKTPEDSIYKSYAQKRLKQLQ